MTDRLDRIERALEAATTIVGSVARYAESTHESFDRLNSRLDEYIYQSQRLINGHEERLIALTGQTERLEAVFAMQQRQMERLEQNIDRLDQTQLLLQQLVTNQQEQLNRQQQQLERMDETQRSTNAALEQLGSILNQLIKGD